MSLPVENALVSFLSLGASLVFVSKRERRERQHYVEAGKPARCGKLFFVTPAGEGELLHSGPCKYVIFDFERARIFNCRYEKIFMHAVIGLYPRAPCRFFSRILLMVAF